MIGTTEDKVNLLRIANTVDELEPILQSVVINDTVIIDALSQLLATLRQMQSRNEDCQLRTVEQINRLQLAVNGLQEKMEGQKKNTVIVSGSDSEQNSEIGLLEYLSTFLSDKTAIDVGANVGKFSERLLKAGYTVYAFEPYAPAFETLSKVSKSEKFHSYPYALGPKDTTMELHIASDLSSGKKWDATLFNSLVEHPMLDDCKFTKTQSVKVRSLDSLEKSAEIPAQAGLLKIDTEGYDLDVIRGMGKGNYPIVMAEFWDSKHPFGMSGNGNLEAIVVEMQKRGYDSHLVIYHIDETATISFYANRPDTLPKSWGNVLFFKDREIFLKALAWCEEVLAPTYFR